jgi:hypothetical protein
MIEDDYGPKQPLDLTTEINDIKRRLESLEARILSMSDTRFGLRNSKPVNYDFSNLKINKGCE